MTVAVILAGILPVIAILAALMVRHAYRAGFRNGQDRGVNDSADLLR